MEVQQEEVKRINKKSLKINTRDYQFLLKRFLNHNSYLNTFSSTQTATASNDGPKLANISLKRSQLHASLPYPFGEPYNLASTEDLCFNLIRQKQGYANKIQAMRQSYKNDKKWLKSSHIKKGKYSVFPEYFLELATGGVKDPDPLFNSDYDYYYTGGILAQATIHSNDYLVRPIETNKLCLTNETITIPIDLDNDEGTIYNIKSNHNKLCIRRKHHLSYYKLKQKGNRTKAVKLWGHTDTTTPFIDIEAYSENQIAYVNVKGELKIADVEMRFNLLHHKFTPELVGLAQIQFLDDNTIFYMNETSVRTFDKRSKDENTFTVEKGFFSCNNLCNFCISDTINNIHLNSRHHNYLFDLRQSKTVTKQPHFLTLPPIVCQLKKYNGSEIVCLTSFTETVCLQTEFMENYLPFKLRNAKATLHECNLRKQLVLNDGVEGRIALSSAGMLMEVNKSNDLTLYTTNTLGDIFCTNIAQAPIDKDLVLSEFLSWSELFSKNERPLKITSVREMSGFTRMLLKPTKMKNLRNYTKPNAYRQKFLSTIDNTTKFDMAAIWSDDKLDVIVGEETEPASKVEQWLRNSEADSKDFDIDIEYS